MTPLESIAIPLMFFALGFIVAMIIVIQIERKHEKKTK